MVQATATQQCLTTIDQQSLWRPSERADAEIFHFAVHGLAIAEQFHFHLIEIRLDIRPQVGILYDEIDVRAQSG